MVTIFSMNPGSSISFAVIPINREKKLHALRHIPVGLWLPVIQRNCGHFALKLFKLLKHEEIMILILLIFQVIYIYTCGQINQTENDHTLCEDAYFWR